MTGREKAAAPCARRLLSLLKKSRRDFFDKKVSLRTARFARLWRTKHTLSAQSVFGDVQKVNCAPCRRTREAGLGRAAAKN